MTDREIPIIAGDYVDQNSEPECVKITPAHDFNDYAMSERHQLPRITIFNKDATLNDAVPEAYCGMDRFEAREQIVAELDALGLIEKNRPT